MLDRRAVLAGMMGAAATSSFPLRSAKGAVDQPALSEEDTRFIEWMDAATGVGKEVAHGTLSVTRFSDAFWYLNRPIEWEPSNGQALPKVSVPKGFVTDFASIPRALWSALPRDGDYVWAAVVHDYLYWFQPTTKDVADDVLNAAMIDLRVSDLQRSAIYTGVSIGGGSSWDQNGQLRAAGERRVLKKFPNEPTTSWAYWKTLPDVFKS